MFLPLTVSTPSFVITIIPMHRNIVNILSKINSKMLYHNVSHVQKPHAFLDMCDILHILILFRSQFPYRITLFCNVSLQMKEKA